jgi:hypothetical protein
MKKTPAASSFRKQMSQSMAELRSVRTSGASPTFNGRLVARTIEVAEPSLYDRKRIKPVRASRKISGHPSGIQAAGMVYCSPRMVHEHGSCKI